MTLELRWQQRAENFYKALFRLNDAVILSKQRILSDLEKQGLIKAYEFTYELAWNVMKDYFIYQGTTGITGSRDAIREAVIQQIIIDGDTWMEMVSNRNKTTHTYDAEFIEYLIQIICNKYLEKFMDLKNKLNNLS